MEKDIQNSVDEMMNSAGVRGVLCADKQGLCLTAQGIANPSSSGAFTSLGQLASTIEPGKEDPVLFFEGQESQCLIKQNDGVTLAVLKTKEF